MASGSSSGDIAPTHCRWRTSSRGNVRTTVVLGHARGVILLAAELAQVPVNEMAPAEIKKAVVGTGGATKEQVQFMLTRLSA